MNYKEDALWQRIEAFNLDDGDARHPFSHKLLQENKWKPEFADRAILEYKKFIYICIQSPDGASPSPIIDQVWHLHLTYTKNYWDDFCNDTLGISVHHNPSKGGEDELLRHQAWYKHTLENYEQIFGEKPPIDIWPERYVEEPLFESVFSRPWKVVTIIGLAAIALATSPPLIFILIIGIVAIESARHPGSGADGGGCGSGCSSGCGSGCGGGCGGCGGD